MSANSNVYSQGGGGTHYEFEIQTAYFINFLIGGIVPGLMESHIIEFKQQSSSLGYNTDDLLLKCTNLNLDEQKVLIQIKHNLIISVNDEEFKKVLEGAWKDFRNSSLFDPTKDKIYIIKSDLTRDEKNHLKQLLNWAKLKATFEDFEIEVLRIDAKRKYFKMFQVVLTECKITFTDQDLFQFLKCLDVLEYDFGHQTSISKSNFLTLIELSKASNIISASQIWDTVFRFVSESDSNGGYFTKTNVPVELSSLFNKEYYSPIEKKLRILSQQNFEIIHFIDDTIGGVSLNRNAIIEDANDKLGRSQFLILSGDPGIGKSAIAKSLLLNSKRSNNYILSFKADDLNDKNVRDLLAPYNIHVSSPIFRANQN